MEKFKLTLTRSISFDLEGIEAVEFLKKEGVDDNKLHIYASDFTLIFSLQELNNVKLLQSLFSKKNQIYIDCYRGQYNQCIDIRKMYAKIANNHGHSIGDFSDCLKEDAKEIFFDIINNIKKDVLYETRDGSTKYSHIDGIFSKVPEIKNSLKQIFDNVYQNKEYKDSMLEKALEGRSFYYYEKEHNSLQKALMEITKEYYVDIEKFKGISIENETKEIHVNDYLFDIWKKGQIVVSVDIDEDNLIDVLNFITSPSGGDWEEFNCDEGGLKAFSVDGHLQMYKDSDGDFVMDVNSKLPSITWNQFITGEIEPLYTLHQCFIQEDIAIDIKNDFTKAHAWIVKSCEFLRPIDEDDTIDNVVYCKDGKLFLVSRDDCKLKVYDWEQFTGLKDLHLYSSTLKEFISHSWVTFKEDYKGKPSIVFAEGCHYKDVDGLVLFEQRVLAKYGQDKNNIIYRRYMLEADKIRLALNLQARTVGIGTQINFVTLLEQHKSKIHSWISNTVNNIQIGEEEDSYTAKNLMWLTAALNKITNEDFTYLEGADDSRYYDLITVEYLDNHFAIPVPVLANILGIEEENLMLCAMEHLDREDIEFI